jgi:hypothetical protein
MTFHFSCSDAGDAANIVCAFAGAFAWCQLYSRRASEIVELVMQRFQSRVRTGGIRWKLLQNTAKEIPATNRQGAAEFSACAYGAGGSTNFSLAIRASDLCKRQQTVYPKNRHPRNP